MTNGAKPDHEPMPAASSPPRDETAAARRPYRAPKLRHLGSVRELTLGGTNGMSEGGGTFFPPGQAMMM